MTDDVSRCEKTIDMFEAEPVMRRYKADANEKTIVNALRAVPGVRVETGHDDILVGFKNRTYWFEIKNPNEVDKNGNPYAKKSKTAKKQKELAENWPGHYEICSSLDDILKSIGVIG